ncbi:MAG: glycosyltransferase [Candidatus Omnitrophica bacterium]|nr:glycosyltransferase [Candidatus Omnitrophota bacterium]
MFEKGMLKEKIEAKGFSFLCRIPEQKRVNKTYLRLKLRDLFSVLYFSLLIKKKYLKKGAVWFYFGVESINAVAGAIVRLFLPIDYIIYYIFDWSVKWFRNRFLNSAYIWFDKIACYGSDFIWNIAETIEEARREKLRYKQRKMGLQLTVPYAMSFRADLVRKDVSGPLNTVVYSGYLSKENGALLFPDLAKEIGRSRQDVRFLVIGGGDCLGQMREDIRSKDIDNIILKDEISDQNEIDRILSTSHIAIAPYADEEFSKKKYGDMIKIRNYFALGLPVVTTSIPPVSREIIKERLGFVVSCNVKDLAEACISLLSDRNLYSEIRANVINKAQNHTWENIYNRALKEMFHDK